MKKSSLLMKVHTSNKEKVESILTNTKINGEFWDYTLHYDMDDTYHKMNPLSQEHYFDLPELKWLMDYIMMPPKSTLSTIHLVVN